MSLEERSGKEVHFPSNPELFQFDAEVSKIFPSMAERSIPMYHEAHRAHVAMLHSWLEVAGVSVLDIGASRGGFLQHIVDAYGEERCRKSMRFHAIDNSAPMCEYLGEDFPYATVEWIDVTTEQFLTRRGRYDIVNMSYVLQFLDPSKQEAVLRHAAYLVRPGGVLIIGQKDFVPGFTGLLAQEEYIQFRIRNGYTRQEIEAKTRALRNAMFPLPDGAAARIIEQCGFEEVQETTRWMLFSTLFCIK